MMGEGRRCWLVVTWLVLAGAGWRTGPPTRQAPQPAEASGDGERQRQREVWQGLVAPPG